MKRLALIYLVLAVVAVIQVTQVRFKMNGNRGTLSCWVQADVKICGTYDAWRVATATWEAP